MNSLYPFEVATPESVGISSEKVLALLEKIERYRLNLHGIIIARKGKVIAEGYWAPFNADYMHRMYSCSKSFTSTAIGALIGEGKLDIDTPVADIFPEFWPEGGKEALHPYQQTMTVRNLLMMATPYESGAFDFGDKEWTPWFINTTRQTPTHPGGSFWHYDTCGTHTLATIVEKLSGMSLTEYLYDRVFRYMDGSEDMWCVKSPDGVQWGGSGIVARQRDLAKLAYLWLNKGRVGDKQLIPAWYIEEGSSRMIDNNLLGLNGRNHAMGYGYKVWRERRNAFSFWGMYTQYAVCFPDEDLLFVCTANTNPVRTDEETLFNLVEDYILDTLSEDALPENPSANDALKNRLESLSLLTPMGELTAPMMEKINGKTFKINKNRMELDNVRFEFDADGKGGTYYFTNAQGDKSIRFGLGSYIEDKFPQDGLSYDTIRKPSKRRLRSLSAAAWVQPQVLELTVYIEEVHCALVTLKYSFYDDGKSLSFMICKYGEDMLNEYWGEGSGKIAP